MAPTGIPFSMNAVWVFMLVVGCLTALVTGHVDPMISAVLDGIQQAVELVIGITGVFCLWVGIERLAEESGLVDSLARLAKPVFGALFPHLRSREREKVLGTVTASILSNVLGLSSSTPLGLKAMAEMKEGLGEGDRGLHSMSTLAVVNAAGFCLFPSTIIALRAALGSRHPAAIAGPTAVAGLAATCAGLAAQRLLERVFRDR